MVQVCKRILAVASGGGYWVELNRLSPAFEGHDVTFVSNNKGYRRDVPRADFRTVRDVSSWNKLGFVRVALRMLWLVLRVRPQVVVSTGAVPGYFALRIGKLFGARTVWIDSMANIGEMSAAGRRIQKHADLWLTQWPNLARADGPFYRGSVL